MKYKRRKLVNMFMIRWKLINFMILTIKNSWPHEKLFSYSIEHCFLSHMKCAHKPVSIDKPQAKFQSQSQSQSNPEGKGNLT